tara:strand:- start:13 stop:261 length:249 start_codon:yes stop_codon:yes gene_type:complete
MSVNSLFADRDFGKAQGPRDDQLAGTVRVILRGIFPLFAGMMTVTWQLLPSLVGTADNNSPPVLLTTAAAAAAQSAAIAPPV